MDIDLTQDAATVVAKAPTKNVTVVAATACVVTGFVAGVYTHKQYRAHQARRALKKATKNTES